MSKSMNDFIIDRTMYPIFLLEAFPFEIFKMYRGPTIEEEEEE